MDHNDIGVPRLHVCPTGGHIASSNEFED